MLARPSASCDDFRASCASASRALRGIKADVRRARDPSADTRTFPLAPPLRAPERGHLRPHALHFPSVLHAFSALRLPHRLRLRQSLRLGVPPPLLLTGQSRCGALPLLLGRVLVGPLCFRQCRRRLGRLRCKDGGRISFSDCTASQCLAPATRKRSCCVSGKPRQPQGERRAVQSTRCTAQCLPAPAAWPQGRPRVP